MKIETILSPAELPALAQRDLGGTVCVVFDILRATSVFVTALQRGAAAIIPVNTIDEAVARRQAQPALLLAGERDGVRIRAAQTGGKDFDFGNSPREFTAERVRGQIICSTTTNGTRALRAVAGAEAVLAASFLNLAATGAFLLAGNHARVLLVCAGTDAGVALEDVLAAGALIDWLRTRAAGAVVLADSSLTALTTFEPAQADLAAAFGNTKNGRRLLANPDLRADVAYCAQRDVADLVALMDPQGALRRV